MQTILSAIQCKAKQPYSQDRFGQNIVLALLSMMILFGPPAHARTINREAALRAAVHPVANIVEMNSWLGRVPKTRAFPPDVAETLQRQRGVFIIEMSTAPGCVPCADLWTKLASLRSRYGWDVRAIGEQEAMLRSGRLSLPWVGHPVAWVRPVADQNRIIPIAIGTDHAPNLARNLYLAAKMLTGVRPAVGVRALSKFTGIVGARPAPSNRPRR